MFSQHETKHKGASRLVSVFSPDIQEEKSRFRVDLGQYRIILSTGVGEEDTELLLVPAGPVPGRSDRCPLLSP